MWSTESYNKFNSILTKLYLAFLPTSVLCLFLAPDAIVNYSVNQYMLNPDVELINPIISCYFLLLFCFVTFFVMISNASITRPEGHVFCTCKLTNKANFKYTLLGLFAFLTVPSTLYLINNYYIESNNSIIQKEITTLQDNMLSGVCQSHQLSHWKTCVKTDTRILGLIYYRNAVDNKEEPYHDKNLIVYNSFYYIPFCYALLDNNKDISFKQRFSFSLFNMKSIIDSSVKTDECKTFNGLFNKGQMNFLF